MLKLQCSPYLDIEAYFLYIVNRKSPTAIYTIIKPQHEPVHDTCLRLAHISTHMQLESTNDFEVRSKLGCSVALILLLRMLDK